MLKNDKDEQYNIEIAKYLLKHLAITMQQYKRNPSVALAYEIGRRQRGLDLFPLYNKVPIIIMLKITIMNNAVKRFVYKYIDPNFID